MSAADTAALNAAHANAQTQQAAVLSAWQAAFGSLPAGQQPIEAIATTIATTWAKPATTLSDIKNSININALLNNLPASGGPVVPVFVVWLNALGAAVTLEWAKYSDNQYHEMSLGCTSASMNRPSGSYSVCLY